MDPIGPPLARAAIDWLLYAPGSDVLTALTRVDVRAHLVDSSHAFRTALITERRYAAWATASRPVWTTPATV